MSDDRLIQDLLHNRPPPPTFAQTCWAMLGRFVVFIIVAAIVGWVIMVALNGLTNHTGLATFNWQEGICVFLLLRVLGVTLFGSVR